MFFPAAKLHKSSSEEKFTLQDLQAAIDKFAAEHKVTPDIFFELLFVAATDYFVEEFAVQHKAMSTEQAKEYLFGAGKLHSTRPVLASLFDFKHGDFFLKFQEQTNDVYCQQNMQKTALNELWLEVIQAYFEHKLGQQFEDLSGMLTTADWKGYAKKVEIPIKAIIRTFLPNAEPLLAKVLSDETKKSAYALPACRLNFDILKNEIEEICAPYHIDTSYCDVLEFSVCNILGINKMPDQAMFYPKDATEYVDFREHFTMRLGMSEQDVENFVAKANTLFPDAIQNDTGLFGINDFSVKYRFIDQAVLPQLSKLLAENVEFRELCQNQYANNCSGRRSAKFYAHYHPAANTAQPILSL